MESTKKFRLTEEVKIYNGVELHRIEALKDFSNVKKGDKGGWVQYESNLSQQGNCWIYGNAIVRDNARVSNDAIISHSAYICDNAIIGFNAHIGDSAVVRDNAFIGGETVIRNRVVVCGSAYINGNTFISNL